MIDTSTPMAEKNPPPPKAPTDSVLEFLPLLEKTRNKRTLQTSNTFAFNNFLWILSLSLKDFMDTFAFKDLDTFTLKHGLWIYVCFYIYVI